MGFTGKLIIVPTYCEIGLLPTFYAGLKPSLYYRRIERTYWSEGAAICAKSKGRDIQINKYVIFWLGWGKREEQLVIYLFTDGPRIRFSCGDAVEKKKLETWDRIYRDLPASLDLAYLPLLLCPPANL